MKVINIDPETSSIYPRIARAIEWMCLHSQEQPSLEKIAAQSCYSPEHFQKLFSQWAGISPKLFLRYLTKSALQERLVQQHTLLEAALESGLSSGSRAFELMVAMDAMTPGEIQRQGGGITFELAIQATPFGNCFIACSPRGITALEFVEHNQLDLYVEQFQQQWPAANIQKNGPLCDDYLAQIFSQQPQSGKPLRCWVKGSNYQIRVWEALLSIPAGHVATYQQIARYMQQPGAQRAVGSAIAKNPVAMLIPCHRVIRASGALGQYRWQSARKAGLLVREAQLQEH